MISYCLLIMLIGSLLFIDTTQNVENFEVIGFALERWVFCCDIAFLNVSTRSPYSFRDGEASNWDVSFRPRAQIAGVTNDEARNYFLSSFTHTRFPSLSLWLAFQLTVRWLSLATIWLAATKEFYLISHGMKRAGGQACHF